jgi:hypothetical protein
MIGSFLFQAFIVAVFAKAPLCSLDVVSAATGLGVALQAYTIIERTSKPRRSTSGVAATTTLSPQHIYHILRFTDVALQVMPGLLVQVVVLATVGNTSSPILQAISLTTTMSSAAFFIVMGEVQLNSDKRIERLFPALQVPPADGRPPAPDSGHPSCVLRCW